MFQVGPAQYARATVAALVVSIGSGILWALLSAALPFLSAWLAIGVGYVAGGAISWATNRKRNRELQVIAGTTVLLAYLVRGTLPFLLASGTGALNAAFLFEVSTRQLAVLFGNPLLLLVFALSIYIAVTRL